MSTVEEPRAGKAREKSMQRAIQRRVAAVREYRIRHNLDKLPEEVDIDDLAPGTAHLVGGHDDDRLVRKLARDKERNGGLIGVHYKGGRYLAMLLQHAIGYSHPTAVEAAEAYNAAARKRFGDRAVLCDLRAARRLEERMTG
ncbi:hypothetical protein UFOVP178_35 [uncultured Caudovirales phage]|uniref:Uncharacterized protein n=1 Tax=uncultured Caudovirales phage TaxID=2100421 RepID=A0A6J7WGL3_9CAUD|nr:hypothetical protein UFOVP178_35 [uncultured Caudovirales phage]